MVIDVARKQERWALQETERQVAGPGSIEKFADCSARAAQRRVLASLASGFVSRELVTNERPSKPRIT